MQNSDSTAWLTAIGLGICGSMVFFCERCFCGLFRGKRPDFIPWPARSGWTAPFLLVLAGCFSTPSVAQTGSPDLQVPPGFVVTKVADNQLCPDVFRLAVSPAGEVYASGPGYLRRLIDEDQDGIFDSSHDFPDGPQTGAQGLYCGDESILVVADGGVWEYFTGNRPVAANRLKRMSIEVGGEHQAHAIKRGPDGWYYLIAGNHTAVESDFFSGPDSPIKKPRAGFLMRISPDFHTREIVAHGFRNPYDFDFSGPGEFLVFDSDGERDIFLPWYRPTRLFRVRAGDDAGWVHEGWKRPSEYFDMPSEMVALGRGSPTAVLRYQQTQFPAGYRQAIFLGDWTFGRVIAVKDQNGQLVTEDFARSTGNSGLAVTDLVMDSKGSLLVSVGGRGTTGAIYRISYPEAADPVGPVELASPRGQADLEDRVYRELEPVARIRGNWQPADWRLIARILGERPPGEESQLASWLDLKATSLSLLVGRGDWPKDPQILEPLVEGLLRIGQTNDPRLIRFLPLITEGLDPAVWQRLREDALPPLAAASLQMGRNPGAARKSELISDLLFQVLQKDLSPFQKRAMCRMAQKLVGDPGLAEVPAVFRGYLTSAEVFGAVEPGTPESLIWPEGQASLLAHQLALGIEIALDAQDTFLAMEIARLAIAMRISSPGLVTVYARQLAPASDPVMDIHWLICLALSPADHLGALKEEETKQIFEQLGRLDLKQQQAGGAVERNWGIRLGELLAVLNQKIPGLEAGLLNAFEGRPGQLFLMEIFTEENQDDAIEKIFRYLNHDPQQADPEHLQKIISTGSLEYQDFFRKAAGLPRFQELAILALTRWPQERDRIWYRIGLDSQNLTLIKESAIALRRLDSPPAAGDLIAALSAARRLGWTSSEVSVRDQLLLMMGREGDALVPYRFQRPGLVQDSSLRQWEQLLQNKYPDVFSSLQPEPSDWRSVYQQVAGEKDWENGDRLRGAALYSELRCAQCHGSIQALGPPLTGISQRFSREDLFRTIAEPDRMISDRYRGMVFETVDGKIYRGIVIYQSVDGVTLQDSQGQTVRLERDSIERQSPSNRSLMPSGLLQGLSPQQYADLWAYLRQL